MSLPKRMLLVVAVTVGLLLSFASGTRSEVNDQSAAMQTRAVPNEVSAAEIAKLIGQLDAEQFADRQAASAKLAAAGKAAVPALTRAAVGPNLEVTVRAMEILKTLFKSSDDAIKAAAKEALETIVKGNQPTAAQRAKSILNPTPPPSEEQAVPKAGAGILIGPGNIGAIQGGIQIIPNAAASNRKMSVKNINGVRDIEVEENGKKIKIHDAQSGIKIEITTNKDGKEVTETYDAKDAEELRTKHPEAHKIYEEYKDQGGGRRVQIQVFGGGGVPNLPPGAVPLQPNAPVPVQGALGAGNTIDSAARLLKTTGQRIDKLTKNEQLQQAPPPSKEALMKEVSELKERLIELEKRLQQDAKRPAEK